MDNLTSYLITWNDGLREQFWAEDESHAKEQAVNSEPDKVIDTVERCPIYEITLRLALYPSEVPPDEWDFNVLLDLRGGEDVRIMDFKEI